MPMLSIPARYDKGHVLLDEDVKIPPNAKLIVTVIGERDDERDAFLNLSSTSLAEAYDDEEVEYDLSDCS